jgi:hypothetical protein
MREGHRPCRDGAPLFRLAAIHKPVYCCRLPLKVEMNATVSPQFVKVPVALIINAPSANVPLPPSMSITVGVAQAGFATGAHENDGIVNDESLVTEVGASPAHGKPRASVLSAEDVIVKLLVRSVVVVRKAQTVPAGHSPAGPN